MGKSFWRIHKWKINLGDRKEKLLYIQLLFRQHNMLVLNRQWSWFYNRVELLSSGNYWWLLLTALITPTSTPLSFPRRHSKMDKLQHILSYRHLWQLPLFTRWPTSDLELMKLLVCPCTNTTDKGPSHFWTEIIITHNKPETINVQSDTIIFVWTNIWYNTE